MKIRPIIFSAPMVQALLAGRKTQTRRIIKPQPFIDSMGNFCAQVPNQGGHINWGQHPDRRPYLQNFMEQKIRFGVGDWLWVRENWQLHSRASDCGTVVYAASVREAWSDADRQIPVSLIGDMSARPYKQGWRPSIHMPRAFSRLTLEVTGVKVERLRDISEQDALAEGVVEDDGDTPGIFYVPGARLPRHGATAYEAFMVLWQSINGSEPANPWIVAVTFDVYHCNVDEFRRAA